MDDELVVELLRRDVVDFDDPQWMGQALVHTLISLDREARAIELAGWRAAAAAGIERARVSLVEADRFLLGLHCTIHAALHGESVHPQNGLTE